MMFYGFGKPFYGKSFLGKPFVGKPFFGKGFPATKASGFNSFIPNTTVATTPFPGAI
ncbi:hypothetical protein STH1839 [Symbiobacterium thermophilum IAM 14863]|uniref:Uncharacterized protein n=2 Tax=Symbiobacterium thermophilum TaxID=2734 RepID=Q67NB9_SYMTH|nr:hypothetical protein STH1839 [Symbiobacterium thermophilum IAM 14863]